ncbi:MAG TPA: Ig-like domain-containing protein, partial [Gemmatimonadaceae bacterium]|nr:Ig-like domain-containing protein [Gemmatimonadaceae bacterium]
MFLEVDSLLMRHLLQRATRLCLFGAVAMLAAGCDEPVGNRFGSPSALRLISGDGQRDTVGATLAESLTVRVVDGAGHSLPGIAVTWGHSPTAGTIDPFTSITDANGFARAAWHLGFVPGPQTATASVVGVTPVLFSAMVLAAIRPGPLDWSLVHRGLPEPAAPVVGIAGSNASDVFAVTANGRAYLFDGFGWSELIAGPAPGTLTSMWGPAANPMFATGVTTNGAAAFVSMFSNQQWTILHSVPGGALHAIHGRSGSDIWAVGSEIAHYDGSDWKRLASPGGTLRAVWAMGGGAAMVGGDDGEFYRVDTIVTSLGNPGGAGIRAFAGVQP